MSIGESLRRRRKKRKNEVNAENIEEKPVNGLDGNTASIPKSEDTEIPSEELSVGSTVAHKVRRARGKITNIIKTPVQKIATGLGVSNGVAGILLVLIVSALGGTGGMMFTNYQYEQQMARQEMVLDNCKEDVEAAGKAGSAPVGDIEAMKREVAEKAWAVFKAIGLSDEQAAGALGNLEGEGGLDPFSFECDYITCPEEAFRIGPKKESYLADLNAWTLGSVFPHYDPSTINEAFYGTSRHGYVAGVGLCGFTGCNYDVLEDWAAGMGLEWYDEEKCLDIQLSLIIAPAANGGYAGSEWLRAWVSDAGSVSTPEQGAEIFCENFEGIPIDAFPNNKREDARKWFTEFGGTMGDQAYADSILELANVTRAGAASKKAGKNAKDCAEAKKEEPDNSDLARAAVAYAWETYALGYYNKGTELYQAVHEIVLPGDPWFMSCDRGVCTAVRWSDADDNFPAGPCPTIMAYCESHPEKWEHIGGGGSVQGSGKLEAGDVCVCYGHVVMYVSNEIVREKYPNSDADFVSASLNKRSPGCGHDDISTRGYEVYRLKEPDNPGQYKDCVTGKNLDDGR